MEAHAAPEAVALVLRLLADLEYWTPYGASTWEQRMQLWPCSHCRAKVDARCTRPNGALLVGADSLPAYHFRRATRACHAVNSLPLMTYREELRLGAAPARVLSWLHQNPLYRRLLELDRIKPPLMSAVRRAS